MKNSKKIALLLCLVLCFSACKEGVSSVAEPESVSPAAEPESSTSVEKTTAVQSDSTQISTTVTEATTTTAGDPWLSVTSIEPEAAPSIETSADTSFYAISTEAPLTNAVTTTVTDVVTEATALETAEATFSTEAVITEITVTSAETTIDDSIVSPLVNTSMEDYPQVEEDDLRGNECFEVGEYERPTKPGTTYSYPDGREETTGPDDKLYYYKYARDGLWSISDNASDIYITDELAMVYNDYRALVLPAEYRIPFYAYVEPITLHLNTRYRGEVSLTFIPSDYDDYFMDYLSSKFEYMGHGGPLSDCTIFNYDYVTTLFGDNKILIAGKPDYASHYALLDVYVFDEDGNVIRAEQVCIPYIADLTSVACELAYSDSTVWEYRKYYFARKIEGNGKTMAELGDYYTTKLYQEQLDSFVAAKPVIYVYNDTDNQSMDLTLSTSDDHAVSITYPVYDSSYTWHFTADMNGEIKVNDRKYNYLYWEDNLPLMNIDITKYNGFCVKGTDTIAFLEDSLAKLGLSDKEQDDFITYWLPRMCNNKYNIITFNPDFYRQLYKLDSTRNIDNLITVYMLFQPSDSYIEIPEQDLTSMNRLNRQGITVVEWGGTEITVTK